MKFINPLIFFAAAILLSPNIGLASVSYGFDFEIKSAIYAGDLSGSLFTVGTQGTGTASFSYQSNPDVNSSYTLLPFSVDLSFNGSSLRLIDSSVLGLFSRQGIIVQNSTDVTFDTILFEGFSGPVMLADNTGNLVSRELHSQLGLFALSDTISNDSLSEGNVLGISNALVTTTFNISSADLLGQVNGSISNFHLLSAAPVPEPNTWLLLASGILLLTFNVKRKLCN